MRTNSRISLTRNVNGAISLDDLQFQFAEVVARLEDYLNNRIDIHLIDTKTLNAPRPTFNKGDLVLDLTASPGIATLQQWDGTKLVPLGFDTIVGFIDLIERGIGSGTDRNKLLASNGLGGWELRIPEQIQFNATELIPAFSLATATGKVGDSANLAHFNKIIGMVIEDVPNGFVGNATVDGEVTNSGWAWSPGSKLFLNGTAISLTAPSAGFSQMVAVARNPQTIIMRMEPPILL
jgi:hypothetical protein